MGDIGTAYADPEDLEERLNREEDDPYSTLYEDLLDAASRRVEAFCRRQFNKTDTASVRRFRPVDWRRLPVDDFHSTDDLVVEVNGTALTSTQFDLRPWGGVVNGVPGWPYSDLIRVGGYWPHDRVPRIEVAAKWGWAEVPEAIKQATLDVAVAMFYGQSETGPVASEAIDGYSVRYATAGERATVDVPPELVKAVPYRRRMFGVS